MALPVPQRTFGQPSGQPSRLGLTCIPQQQVCLDMVNVCDWFDKAFDIAHELCGHDSVAVHRLRRDSSRMRQLKTSFKLRYAALVQDGGVRGPIRPYMTDIVVKYHTCKCTVTSVTFLVRVQVSRLPKAQLDGLGRYLCTYPPFFPDSCSIKAEAWRYEESQELSHSGTFLVEQARSVFHVVL